MGAPIQIKIDVTQVVKEHMFKSTKVNQRTGKCPVYLDLVAFENRDGPDQYGNTHTIKQGISKQAREQGVQMKIIGNMKMPGAGGQPAAPRQQQDAPPDY